MVGILALSVAVVLGPPAGCAVARGTPPDVHVEFGDDRLTVVAVDAPRPVILERIAEATGAEVHGVVDDAGPLTVSLETSPVREAIARIVRPHNFTLRYGADGSLRRITIHGRRLDATTPASRVPAAAGHSARFAHQWIDHPAVAVGPHLAAALGETAVPLPRLLQSIRTIDQPWRRRAAVAHFVRAVESSPTLHAAWLAMPPRDLVRFLTTHTGDRVQETLTNVAASATKPATRTHAIGARKTLPLPPARAR